MSDKELARIREAYLAMAKKVKYRPCAPGDGAGSIDLTDEDFADRSQLNDEASQYAAEFIEQEDKCTFWIGVSNFRTNRALVYTLEAARLLCGVKDEVAIQLLKMAIKEIETAAE